MPMVKASTTRLGEQSKLGNGVYDRFASQGQARSGINLDCIYDIKTAHRTAEIHSMLLHAVSEVLFMLRQQLLHMLTSPHAATILSHNHCSARSSSIGMGRASRFARHTLPPSSHMHTAV